MTRNIRVNLITILTLTIVAFASQANAQSQKMQPMTTIQAPQGVQIAQANASRNVVGQDSAPANANTRANLASNANQVASSQPVGQPGDEPLYYVVQDFQGKVQYAKIGTDVTTAGGPEWTVVKKGDRLGAGLVIVTPVFGGALKLVLDPSSPPTVMALESGTMIAIDDLAMRNGVSVARLALGVGAVKAGVAESGDTRSDMTITTPTGTLSKKGTDIFRVEYQNGRFRMSLSENGRGLIQAIQFKFGSQGDVIGSRSRFVTRGQFVTQEMFKAIDHVRFDRDININDLFGQTGNEILTILNNRGFGFLLPIGENTVNILGSPNQQPTDGMNGLMNGISTAGLGTATPRRDGDFGIGQTILPVRSPLGGAGRRIVKSRQNDCGPHADQQCRQSKRVMKRRM
ncbi:MAG: hypothetical protein H6818_04760 [Phycisphaerales bacterium]|nr:hypothetical protein [Phycisphaerales bacterium]